MRDVALIQAKHGQALDRAVSRAKELLGGDGRRVEHVTFADAGFALVQSERTDTAHPVALHHTPREALAFTGYVLVPPRELRGHVEVKSRLVRGPRATMPRSPGGIYACFLVDAHRRTAFVWSSLGGVEVAYYTVGDDVTVVSNRPLLSHLLGRGATRPTFDARWTRRILLGDSTLWNDTPYDGTCASPPRSTLVLDERGVRFDAHPLPLAPGALATEAGVTALHDAALGSVEVLRGWPVAELQLSGGKDSRMVAALVARAGIEVDALTFGPPDRGEPVVAAQIAAFLRIPHRPATREIATGDELAPMIERNLRRGDALLPEMRQLAFAPMIRPVNQPVLEGQAHHPRGGFKTRIVRDESVVRERLHQALAGDATLLRRELLVERTRRVDELLDGYRVRHPADLAYWMYADWRMARLMTAASFPSARERLHVMPMLDERVLQVCAQLSPRDRGTEETFYAVLERLAPGIGRIPLYEDIWKFDGPENGPFPDGRAERSTPYREPPPPAGNKLSLEKRLSTVLPLARTILGDTAGLRDAIEPAAVDVLLNHEDPPTGLGLESTKVVRFCWKVATLGLVQRGNWFDLSAGAR